MFPRWQQCSLILFNTAKLYQLTSKALDISELESNSVMFMFILFV